MAKAKEPRIEPARSFTLISDLCTYETSVEFDADDDSVTLRQGETGDVLLSINDINLLMKTIKEWE